MSGLLPQRQQPQPEPYQTHPNLHRVLQQCPIHFWLSIRLSILYWLSEKISLHFFWKKTHSVNGVTPKIWTLGGSLLASGLYHSICEPLDDCSPYWVTNSNRLSLALHFARSKSQQLHSTLLLYTLTCGSHVILTLFFPSSSSHPFPYPDAPTLLSLSSPLSPGRPTPHPF